MQGLIRRRFDGQLAAEYADATMPVVKFADKTISVPLQLTPECPDGDIHGR
jgi:hypothetical protein